MFKKTLSCLLAQVSGQVNGTQQAIKLSDAC